MNQKVIIWDSKTGNWEVNKLKHPLMHDYNTGMCSVKLLKPIKTITKETKLDNFYLKGQKWYFYIWFGVQLGFKLILTKIDSYF